MPALASLVAVASLAPQIGPHTWTVGPTGAQFTQITAAIAASTPGDVILVAPGSYSSFTLSKGLTIIGSNTGSGAGVTRVGTSFGSTPTLVRAVAANERTLVADISFGTLRVESCPSTVSLVRIDALVQAETCADLRMFQFSGRAKAEVGVDRIELVECDQASNPGTVLSMRYPATQIGAVLVTGPKVEGAPSWSPQPPCFGTPFMYYDASPAILVWASSVVVAGTSQDFLRGGQIQPNGCFVTFGQAGLYVEGGVARTSGVTITSTQPGVPPVVALAHDVPVRVDPSLELVGTPRPGATVQLVTHGEPGDWVRLELGRAPTVLPVPGSPVPRLVTPGRAISLGPIPVSGSISVPMTIPAATRPGEVYWAQSSAVDPLGHGRATNSFPIVVRP